MPAGNKILLKRLWQAPLILFILITISFILMRFAPGGPFSSEREFDPEVQQALNERFHLDKSVPVQYFHYMTGLAVGDLGPSLKHKDTTVSEIIGDRLPNSIVLGFSALVLAIGLGCSAGIISALRAGSSTDYSVMLLAVGGISIPAFVTGPILQTIFSVKLDLLPAAGYEGAGAVAYLILPSLTLSFPFIARIARLVRTGMVDTLNNDYIQTAKAKGLSMRKIVFRHALPGAIIPVVSYLGPAAAAMLTGSLVVEKIFQIPGLGREFVESALNRDYPLVMGTVIVYGSLLILFNILTDIIHTLIDPRLRRKM